ncbi:MAG: TonB-dependent receptor, partial [Gemmatimonadetes bacterium]|nr:TonB-dependent receptor [Gemmatimonadota bacterium]
SGPYRLNAGLRYDHNSVYGGTVNPRLSAIYRFAERGSIKALYGEAFQEPAPIQLWGGWQGRLANPDLDPEKVRTVELIAMYQTGRVLFDASVYRATYDNVLKEEAENAGERTIVGLELRPRFTLANPIADSPDITGHFYYTLTQARSSIRYDPELADWIDSETDLGDIAPSKIRAGLVVPIRDRGSVYLGSRYESAKKLYLRNPLRWQGEELDGWMVIDAAVNLHLDLATLRLRVNNLLDNDYFHSGVEAASSGNDVTQRSLGWMNSLVPQAGRNVQLTLSYNY